MHNYLLIGQGIAGTLLAHFLQQEGQSVLVVDQGHERASSNAAAGIINPITGRRYVKSWRVDELIPFARETYYELERQLDIPIFHPRNILRTLFNQKEENDWQQRFADEAYQAYLVEEVELGDYADTTVPAFSYGEVTHSAQVDLPLLIQTFRKKLLEKEILLEEPFDYEALKIDPDGCTYKGQQAQRVIFCEGWRSKVNPWFSYLPFGGSKGEVLIVKIPDVHYEKLLKHRVFIVPIGEGHYWIGSAYDNQFKDESPTQQGKTFLKERLEEVLEVDFEIVEHLAAVRPTVKDRRPFLGVHPEFPQLFLFNGLGTKGASLGPFFARQMTDFLLEKGELDASVDIRRYQP